MRYYIIVIKNPLNDKIFTIEEDDDFHIKTYDTYEEAKKEVDNSLVAKYWPYEIVEIDL
jgi:hypothetical protein